ncbi:diaminopimelate epimerase [Bacillus sp. FJAT-49736]|uniref:diaminopimelate epimerase n=1 Tax=Bacillus sp. FJAT-49736 TaxID=2833582 RepID=UPI001BC9E668|nr:diaminopimelate epimerase [Bacillus sp. FJAT-49736]
MKIQLKKCHGSNNDFILIDEISNSYDFTDKDRENLAIALCDRNSRLGADGILFVMFSDICDAKMRIFNADGSEASMCGNGLRCAGRYLCELLQKDELIVETLKANLKVQKAEYIYNQIPTYQVEISPVLFQLDQLPMMLPKEKLFNEKVTELSQDLLFSAVAVPNPHLISFVDETIIRSNIQKTISEYVNGPNDLFPNGVNVSFVKFIQEGRIYVRTFERGVGFTNACGTAMSASSLVSCLLHLNEIEEEIEVFTNGGKVRCIVHKMNDDYKIDLIGNATFLYEAEIEVELYTPEDFSIVAKTESLEQNEYEQLERHAKEVVDSILF